MNNTRLLGLAVVMVLLLVAVAGGGYAAGDDGNDDSYTVVIYNPAPEGFESLFGSFLLHLEALGYGNDTTNMIVAADGDGLAKALAQDVNLILSVPGEAVFKAGVDLGDIPVVFAPARDPVAAGMVETLEAPGGQATGVLMADLTAARFNWLLELVPDAQTVYVVSAADADDLDAQRAAVDEAADEAGVALVMAEADLNAAVDALPDDIDAVFLLASARAPLGAEWPQAALAHNLPLVVGSTVTLTAPLGPVLSYEHDLDAIGAQAAELAAQILDGAAPGDVPVVEGATWLTLDRRIAEAIGLDVPGELLDTANEVLTVETAGELPPLEPVGDMAAAGGACNARLVHPGGENIVCLNVPCDVPLDAGFIRYEDREPVDACPTEGVIGTCEMGTFDMLHYDGEVSAVQRGCVMLMGEWVAPE